MMKNTYIFSLILLTFLLPTASSSSSQALAQTFDTLTLEKIADDLTSPVAVAHAGDGRLFVALLGGEILLIEDHQIADELFLDLSDRVHPSFNKGLYGIAFPPNFGDHGFFFVSYTGLDLSFTVSRFSVGNDPRRADPASEKILIQDPKETGRHNAGQLVFGPDGYLYIATGDGSTNVPDPHCASLSQASLEGKVLRIDVVSNLNLPQADVPPYYLVPEDNPFADGPAPEIWSLGLRNPWKMSFDRESGDLWIGDVGENELEEINRQSALSTGGENYGWKVMEGTACFSNDCPNAPACNSADLTLPTLEYTHEEGRCSITGGYVYRGAAIPDLIGHYLYGDFCSGEIRATQVDTLETMVLPIRLPGLTAFGEDAEGEIYAVDGNSLYRLVEEAPEPTCIEDAFTLCLNDGRFRVTAEWETRDDAGPARARPFGSGPADSDVGTFWFFSANNAELFVKILDACFDPFNHYWVFVAGLTDVGVEITVVDTETELEKIYRSARGTPFSPVQDTRAFATCP